LRVLRDAYSFIIPLVLLGSICLLLGWQYGWGFYLAAGLFYLLALFVAFFFRDPERPIPTDERLVVSPADGLIVAIKPADSTEGGRGTLVCIFLSIFDVHVNRSPISGKIVSTDYRPGKFLVAAKEKASVENEMNVVTVENQYARVVFKQIAGLIARRIVFWKKIDDRVQLGERVGLIKFGSRVDILLPENVVVMVKRGEHVKGGISVIGRVGS
jgi:phosphatidylserine decarboxylase